jgi:hypothetical protein
MVNEVVRFHPGLGRPSRGGTWEEQATSTFRTAARAAAEGRTDDAVSLARYAIQESKEAHQLYPVFVEEARRFLVASGVDRGVVAKEERRILDNLRMPDGSEFDFEEGWRGLREGIDRFEAACRAGETPGAVAILDEARETWRRSHDRACDWVYGMVDVCARLLGEDRVVDLWDAMMGPFYPSRDRYDVDRTPWSESLEVLAVDTLETFRGHLSGPERTGDVEVTEEEDRFVFRFDPCGTGGRTYRPDAEGGPPRMEPPFNYAVTTRPHDWSWGKEGVCLYCVHCCQLQERVPIERFGYPIRVVDPPVWPEARSGGKCTWYVYKDPSLIPDEAYRRVGAERPEAVGSRARRAAAKHDG